MIAHDRVGGVQDRVGKLFGRGGSMLQRPCQIAIALAARGRTVQPPRWSANELGGELVDQITNIVLI